MERELLHHGRQRIEPGDVRGHGLEPRGETRAGRLGYHCHGGSALDVSGAGRTTAPGRCPRDEGWRRG